MLSITAGRLKNRSALMPTRDQVDRAVAIVAAAETRLKGRIRLDSVVPDYYARYPKACMGGCGGAGCCWITASGGSCSPAMPRKLVPGLVFRECSRADLVMDME